MNSDTQTLIDGKEVKGEVFRSFLPLLSSGCGCFETLLVFQGKIELFEEHLRRAYRSCHVFLEILPCNFSFEDFRKEIWQSVQNFASTILLPKQGSSSIFFQVIRDGALQPLSTDTAIRPRWKDCRFFEMRMECLAFFSANIN